MRTEAQIQRRAMEVLRQAGVSLPPVDPSEIASYYSIAVQAESAEDDISGALYRHPDGVVIGVNASHHPNRQRFTVAHELGHFFLHDAPVYVDRAYASSPPAQGAPAFLRNNVSGQAIDPAEIEANRFAASLLMPRDFLLQDLAACPIPVAPNEVERLAGRYRVSPQAMSYRLNNLGVPLDVAF